MQIRIIHTQCLEGYIEHMVRKVQESGLGGRPIFNLFTDNDQPKAEDLRSDRAVAIGRNLDEPRWRRIWAVEEGNRFVGGCEVIGDREHAGLHRACITIGIESSHHRLGLASRLLEVALAWAVDQPLLEWLDLDVFANNEPAVRLYENFGFTQTAIKKDRFRLEETSVDLVQMSRRVMCL